MSKRHSAIVKLTKAAITLAGAFGIISIAYMIAENSLGSSLDRFRAIEALNTSVKTDKAFLAQDIKKESSKCNTGELLSCREYIGEIIKSRNRLKDYRILLSKTLGYADTSEEVTNLTTARLAIDKNFKEIFGISFSDAKNQKAGSVDELIMIIQKNKDSKNGSINERSNDLNIYRIVNNSLEYIRKDIISQERGNYDPIQAMEVLRKIFIIMITGEILLFIIVNSMDLIITNAGEEADLIFNFKKIAKKLNPLAISILFAFMYMILGQNLLIRESERSMITHCRELNKQNIGFYNSLEIYEDIKKTNLILAEIELDQNCKNRLEDKIIDDLTILAKYPKSDERIEREIYGMKFRIYADGFQDIENEFGENTGNMLFTLLILNVLTMSTLAIFLRYDSEDIG